MSSLKAVFSRPADKFVVWTVLALCAAGVVAVYSAITFLAETKGGGDTERYLLRHASRVGLALLAMGVFSVINYRWLARHSRWLLLGSMGLLVLVQIVGVASGGAVRWIEIMEGLQFQPSDLAKVALMLYLATLLTRKQAYIKSFKRAFLPMLVWIGLTVVLIGMEDLSTAAIVLLAALIMCFVGRVSVLHLGGLGVAGLVLAYLMLLSSPSRAARVEAYFNMDLFAHTDEQVFDVQAEGYQAQQAKIAIANGGLRGVGPGKSTQRDFLPAPYNDFIFAIVTEEYGLLGALVLLAGFVVLLFRGYLRIARNAEDPLGLFLAVGLTTMIVLYGFVHAGVSTGILPVTGLPMPFVSYGGTALLAMGAMTGILLNVSRSAGSGAAGG